MRAAVGQHCGGCGHRFKVLEDEYGMHECPRCGWNGREPEDEEPDPEEETRKAMNKHTFTVTRMSPDRFAVTSDIFLSDGSYRADHNMALDGHLLRSVEQHGFIRIGGLLRLTLSDERLAQVQALAVGEKTVLGGMKKEKKS